MSPGQRDDGDQCPKCASRHGRALCPECRMWSHGRAVGWPLRERTHILYPEIEKGQSVSGSQEQLCLFSVRGPCIMPVSASLTVIKSVALIWCIPVFCKRASFVFPSVFQIPQVHVCNWKVSPASVLKPPDPSINTIHVSQLRPPHASWMGPC